jgi:hypothetical protein
MTAQQPAPIPRDHPRFLVRIPVQVEIAHAWEGSTRTSRFGSLFNVSRGGAGLSMSWVVPPRTRFSILVPAVGADVRLLAEVVWTSLAPGRDPESATYGLRWIEYLSGRTLQAMLPSDGPRDREPVSSTPGG